MTKGKSKNNLILTGILVALAIFGFGAAGYMYLEYTALRDNPNASQEAATNKANEMKDKVSKLINVPADETPTLATVSDKEKLKDQAFFENAENGDTILLFPQAKKAYIYRENENKLINVGPIAITSDSSASATE